MQLGISSYTYTWAIGVPGQLPEHPLTVFGLLDKATALGLRVVQVADNLPLDALSDEDLNRFAQKANEQHIHIEVGTRGIAPDHLRRYLHLAEQLRSPILRVVIDTAAFHPTVDEVIDTFKSLISEFEQHNICLAIENHDRFGARTFMSIVERVASPCIGICLDTVNSFGALEGPEIVLDVLGPAVVNLHVKDFSIRRASHMMGFTIEGTPAGQGRLNVPWMLERLRSFGRDPNAILELWTPPEFLLENTIAKEDAWARESVQMLRQWIAD